MTNPNQSPRDALASAVRAHQAARDALAPLHKRATEAQDAEAERIGLEAEWREFVAEDGLREAPDVTTRERLKGSLLSARRRADGHAAALEAYHGGVAAIEATAQGQRHAVAAVLRAEVERLEGEWRELAAKVALKIKFNESVDHISPLTAFCNTSWAGRVSTCMSSVASNFCTELNSALKTINP